MLTISSGKKKYKWTIFPDFVICLVVIRKMDPPPVE